MKSSKLFILFLISSLLINFSPLMANPKLPKKEDFAKVEKLERAPNFFKSGNMFFSGQPNLETLQWLNSEGVDLVINLRTQSENDDFALLAFNEEEQVAKLGMKYINIPIDGYDSYTTENVAKLAKTLDGKYKKVLIHCASCNRVTYFMMAYLVDFENYKLAEAVEFGKQLKFTFPLESLLKEEVNWDTK